MHVTLSAHPFVVQLPPGRYTLTVERGKEYHPERREVTVGDEPVELTVRLRRFRENGPASPFESRRMPDSRWRPISAS